MKEVCSENTLKHTGLQASYNNWFSDATVTCLRTWACGLVPGVAGLHLLLVLVVDARQTLVSTHRVPLRSPAATLHRAVAPLTPAVVWGNTQHAPSSKVQLDASNESLPMQCCVKKD